MHFLLSAKYYPYSEEKITKVYINCKQIINLRITKYYSMKTHIDILPREVTNDKFSVFGCGYRNKDGVAVLAAKPNQSQDIAYIGNYIQSDRAQWATNTLRSMLTTATKDELGDFKKLYFETATFNGIFSYRSARNLVTRSPFLVLDIDDLESTDEARYVQSQLVGDPAVETALCFVSPKGQGVKWVVRLPEWAQSPDFKTTFQKLQQYVGFEYGIAVDKSGSDVCRACFLPYDKDCFINPKYQHV